MAEWGEPAGLSDDQWVSRGEDERGDRGSVHFGAGAAGGRRLREAGELLCGWEQGGSERQPAQGGVGEEPGEVPGATAREGEGAAERDRAVNEAENEAYGDKDLEELGGGGGIDAEKLEKKIAELNQRLKEKPEDKKLAKAVKVMEKDYLPRQKRYEEQERKLAGRSSYSKTDEDATFFRMKEDRGAEKPLPKPAYNVQLGQKGSLWSASACTSEPETRLA